MEQQYNTNVIWSYFLYYINFIEKYRKYINYETREREREVQYFLLLSRKY